MRASRPLSLLAALLLCLCAGCGTTFSLVHPSHLWAPTSGAGYGLDLPTGPYSGVRTDLSLLSKDSVVGDCAVFVDLPLSLVCDTALLPYTIWIPRSCSNDP